MRDQISNRWLTFTSLSLLFFVVSAGAFNSLGVVLPAMVREMGWNWTQAGFGFTLLGLACGLASFVPAMLIRRIGVRGNMIVGTAALVAGFVTMGMTHSVWAYFAATTLIGLAFALCATVPATHVLNEIFDKRSTALGAYFTIGALGSVAGPLVYVWIQTVTSGWRGYWAVFVVLAIVTGLFAILTTPKRHDESKHDYRVPEQVDPVEMFERMKEWTVRRALATPQFYIIVGGYTAYLLINTTAHGFAVEHLVERGVSANSAAYVLSLEALIGAAISVIGGAIGEKVSAKSLMIASLVAVTVGMVALAEASGWPLMLVFALGVGMGFGLSFLSATMLLYNYFGKGPNLELYSIMCMISTSAALGTLFGGWARDELGSFSGMFLLCAAITVVILVAAIFMRPPTLESVETLDTVPEHAA